MKFVLKILFLILLTNACSTLSHNNVEQEQIRFMGGVHKNETWDDPLVFNRVSWFHGLTLYYEALFYRVDSNAKFFKWFSPTEKEYVDRCFPFLISIVYSADPDKISHSQFRQEMENNGFDTIPVMNFARSLKAHPHYNQWSLSQHRVMGFCRTQLAFSKKNYLSISFPSFMQAKIDI